MGEFVRMELALSGVESVARDGDGPALGGAIRTYEATEHRDEVLRIYNAAFPGFPWPDDWYRMPQLEREGIFLHRDTVALKYDAFAIAFGLDGEGYIYVVAVEPPARRKGIASSLIRRELAYLSARGYQNIVLDVEADNVSALAFYENLGFRPQSAD